MDRRLKQLKTTEVAVRHALDVEKYRLYNRSSKRNTSVLRKMSKHMAKVRMMIGKEGFEGNKPITTILFLMEFRMACRNTDIHEGAAV